MTSLDELRQYLDEIEDLSKEKTLLWMAVEAIQHNDVQILLEKFKNDALKIIDEMKEDIARLKKQLKRLSKNELL